MPAEPQEHDEPVGAVTVVIDDEDFATRGSMRRSIVPDGGARLDTVGPGQSHGERAAAPKAITRRLDRPAVQVDEALDQ